MADASDQDHDKEPTSGHVGALLKASRQRLNEDLPDVALMLRIRLPYLEAIEAGRYRDLPGATYAVGFIRAYAEHLGLDSEEVVRRFKAETVDGGADQKLSFPTPVPETGIPGGAYVFIGLVIAVLAYGGWYVSTTEDGFFAELISPLDEQLTSLLDDEEGEAPIVENDAPDSQAASDGALPSTDETVSSREPIQQPAADTKKPDASQQAQDDADEPRPVIPPVASGSAEQEGAPVSEPSAVAEPTAPSQEQSTGTQVVEPVTRAQPAPEPSEPQPVVPETAEASAPSDAQGNGAEPQQQLSPSVSETVSEATQTVAPSEPAPSAPLEAEVPASSSQPVETPDARQIEVAEIAPPDRSAEEPQEAPRPEERPSVASAVSPDPEQTANAETAAAPVQVEPSEELSVAPIADIESETVPAPFVGSAGTESEVAVPVPPSVPNPPANTASEVAARTSSDSVSNDVASRITINARNDSWIEVRDTVADDVIFTGLLSAGEAYQVPDRPGLIFLTGNAGALDIVVDGETVPPIGGNGVVLSGVVLEAARLKAGTAVGN